MQMPERMPMIPRLSQVHNDGQKQARATRDGDKAGIEQAACCAQVCTPFTGCHCVLELPICP